MKTKIKELIDINTKRIIELQKEQELAEKLGFNTQCSALSKAIHEIVTINACLKALI
jgi:hypothetical protein